MSRYLERRGGRVYGKGKLEVRGLGVGDKKGMMENSLGPSRKFSLFSFDRKP